MTAETRGRLRVPQIGDVLFGEGMAVVADTIEQARDIWEGETGDRLLYMHSSIGSCRVVDQNDVESGDAHEDAEPGDTTVDYRTDDGRELRSSECRVWEPGAPRLCDWQGIPERGCSITDVPVGTLLSHPRLGDGELLAPAYRDPRCPRTYAVPIRFGEREIVCLSDRLSIVPTANNWHPPVRNRLMVDDELVAVTRSDWAFSVLRDVRETRLRLEWEAQQFSTYEAAACATPGRQQQHRTSPRDDSDDAGTPTDERRAADPVRASDDPVPQRPASGREPEDLVSGAATGEQGTGTPGGDVGAAGPTPTAGRQGGPA